MEMWYNRSIKIQTKSDNKGDTTMERKDFFKTVCDRMAEYLPFFCLIGNCVFCMIAAMFAVDAVALNHFGIELGWIAITIHAIWFGIIGGVWLTAFATNVVEKLKVMFCMEDVVAIVE